MLLLVLSDFHIGKGRFFRNGQINILEDFFEDDRFVEFLDYYSSGKYHWSNVHLVLNGDILNLIQVDIDGAFTHIIDDDRTVQSIKDIAKGHPTFFSALAKFLQRPNKKVTYIIGNHDAGMSFDKAKRCFCDLVKADVEFTMNKNICGVYIEHGHRFEVINTVDPKEYYIRGPRNKKILNLPWGSLFCLLVLPRLKKFRPNINRIRPVSVYIKWCLFHDFIFFWKMAIMVVVYFIKTGLTDYAKQNRNFKTTLKLLKQVTIYPRYGRRARKILRKNRLLKAVIMGHTHLHEWRRYADGRYYFNTGTWNSISSVDAGRHDSEVRLAYVMVDIHSKSETVRSISMNQWKGSWNPYIEEVTTTFLGN